MKLRGWLHSGKPEPVGYVCCDYRDHADGLCPCPEHLWSDLHPFGGRG